MNITKTITRSLPVPLTTDEKVEYGRNLAVLHQEYLALERAKKVSADDFKEKLEGIDGATFRLATIVRNQEEYRTVECSWRYLFETNSKELIRMDTGEIVETATITAEERQMLLQLEQDRVADAAKETTA